jgi:hypothetical protein
VRLFVDPEHHTERDAGDGSSHPAVVYVAPSGRLDTSIERDESADLE